MIKDITSYPQDLFSYVMLQPSSLLITQEKTLTDYSLFKEYFFQPWNTSEVNVSTDKAYAIFSHPNTKDTIIWWAENLLPWTDKNWQYVKENAACSTYPSCMKKGILVERISVCLAPTPCPFFSDPSHAGNGFPFDDLVDSNLHLGMPVLVTHTSADGAWFFIETKLVYGWVPRSSVAIVSTHINKRFSSLPQAVIIHDHISLRESLDHFVGLGYLGTVLPIEKITENTFILLAPIRDQYGNAHIVNVEVPKDDVMLMLQLLTAERVAAIGDPLIGQNYGWGGSFGLRDCSELMRDLFVPFGIWLPRNSSKQIYAWDFIETEHLSRDEYTQVLETQATPFATLLGFKGHIGLYLGMYNDTPVMLHNIWGIRTDENKKEGRYIIGRTVVTSLEPGAEMSNVYETLFDLNLGISVLQTSKHTNANHP